MQVCCVFKGTMDDTSELDKIFKSEKDGENYIKDEQDRRKDSNFKPNYWIEMRSVEEY